MPVKVSFIRPGPMGSIDAVGVGSCRICETITVPGSTTASAQEGEIVLLVSTEGSAAVAAHGTTPDAAATAQTTATSAGYGVPSGILMPIAVKTGDKISIKAFV